MWKKKQNKTGQYIQEYTVYSFSIAGFKFIFIYLFLSTEPKWQSEYSTFSSNMFFFPFSFVITQNKRTLSAIRRRTDSAVLSLPFHSARLYTQKDCTTSLLHFQPTPTNIMIGQSECLKTIIFNLHLAYSVAWHTLVNTHAAHLHHTHTAATQGDLCATDSQQRRGTAVGFSGLAHLSKPHYFGNVGIAF